MLIKFDKNTAKSKNGNEFLRGIVATGELAGGRCIVWEGDELFDCLPGQIVEAQADVRDFVAVTDEKTRTTYESWVLAELDVTKTLEGADAAAVRGQISEAQIVALKNRGPRRVGQTASVTNIVAEAGVEATAEALMG